MATVRFSGHFEESFPDLPKTLAVDGVTVAEALRAVDTLFPGWFAHVADANGALRNHVHVFVDGAMVEDRTHLGDRVGPDSELYVVQALSG